MLAFSAFSPRKKINKSEMMTLPSNVGRRCGSSDGDGDQDMKRSGENGRIYQRGGDGGDRGLMARHGQMVTPDQTPGAVKMSTNS